MPPTAAHQQLIIDGHPITVTHPDRVVFPEDGITKGEVVEYYRKIAERMLSHVRERPLHMNRFPGGIKWAPIQQKRVPDSFPGWIKRVTVGRHGKGDTITHAVIDDQATLVYLANYNMITAHVWLSRVEAPDRPDQLIFDLDPSDEDFTLVRNTALALRELLQPMQLEPFVKTTGSRGLHVVVPIEVGPSFEEAHLFADYIGQKLAATNPTHLTTEFIKEERKGRLFIDVNRNAYAQTAVAAYSIRAKRTAPIAVPIDWGDVKDSNLKPDGINFGNVWDWLKSHSDPWKDMYASSAPLPSINPEEKPDRSGRRRGVPRKR
jgi:bifunctional non-homologous end joining protein LigD